MPEMPADLLAEWREHERKERVARAGLLPADLEKTFESFDGTQNPKALAVAKAFAENFTAGLGVGLLFYGPAGVGKTHLAMAIAKRVVERGFEVRRWAVADLMAHARSAFADQESEQIQDLFADLGEADLVVFDDLSLLTLASAYEHTRACEFLFRVFDTCLAHKTAMIVTTNHGLRELQAKLAELDGNSERIFSRLREAVWPVEVSGKNMRAAARLARTPDWLRELVAAGKEG